MMDEITIMPGRRKGSVEVPFSKSHLHRLMIAVFLAGSEEVLPVSSEDVAATRRCLAALEDGESVPELDCGESGSTLRFLLPLAMALHPEVRFLASGRLPERPIAPFLDLLCQHGVSCREMRFPLSLRGTLQPGRFSLPGNISSQIVTGLLFALPLLPDDSGIHLTTPLESGGYVDMTLDVLRSFGIVVRIREDGYDIPGKQIYRKPLSLGPERDWSGAAFWFAMNHLGSRIQMEGMAYESYQPDRAICRLLQCLGGEISVTQCPDLFPALAVAAGAFPADTVFTGVRRLRLKESDRLAAMQEVLSRFGVTAKASDEAFCVYGIGPHFRGNAVIPTFNDHRIAMAAAIGATIADAPTHILNPLCTKKSYPDFFGQLDRLEIFSY